MNSIIVFAKYPQAGKVKTRLGASIGYQLAADFYTVFLRQTLDFARSGGSRKVFLAFEPPDKEREFAEMMPPDCAMFPQVDGDLGERLARAFETSFAAGATRVLALGSDSPTLPPALLNQAFSRLDDCDLVIGPAEDGGYCLIGLKSVRPELFRDIEWSSNSVLSTTLAIAARMKLATALLDRWYDVDDVDTLRRAARDDRSGEIAAMLTQLPTTPGTQ